MVSRPAMWLVVLTAVAAATGAAAADASTCQQPAPVSHDYSQVLTKPSKLTGINFDDLPGFTRSVYRRDHALVAPESRVWTVLPGWKNTVTAHIVSPASGAHFLMYLADMKADAEAPLASPGVERFVFVLNGELAVTTAGGKTTPLKSNHWAYIPADDTTRITSTSGAGFLAYERVYAAPEGGAVFAHGFTEDSPLLPTAGEVFELRKLLPATTAYDFNVHVMDFQPGEYLNVKEIHYNQHGLLLLEGKGIYRLGDNWYPVQAGDAVYMGPYVPQWYCALGSTPTRYIIYKDTVLDPLLTPLH